MEADAAKRAAAQAAALLIDDGARVGLGTGSTARHFIIALGERVREGLRVSAVPTSIASAELATQNGIPVVGLDAHGLDIAVDGADQVDPALRLIKGRGGAIVREKIVAAAARRFIVIVDGSKLCDRLQGQVPVEVVEFGMERTLAVLEQTRGRFSLRRGADGDMLRTDNGNLLADGWFDVIDDPEALAAHLDATPGVVGHGMFLGLTDLVLVGGDDGSVRRVPARENS